VRPNILLIVTDNQSPWTLGCYGNGEILTPNIDRLAAEGARFTQSFCSNPVCSPNRATLLTGLMPSQHGVHNWLGQEKPDAQMGPDAYCTIGEFTALPQLLSNAGYACGMVGKWHLGDSLHPQLGFDYWFTMPRGHTAHFYSADAIWEGQVYREPRYFLQAIADHAVDFLRNSGDKPFFLYVGFNGPYGLDRDMREGHRNRHTEYYADKELRCFPREDAHPWLKQNLDCIRNTTCMRSYACAVSGVDDGVGDVLEALAELGLEENTLVVFTADHGLCGGHHGTWGMGDHSRPLHVFQPNLRVPLIIRHPGRIPTGRLVEEMTCNYDVFPSLLSYLGMGCPSADTVSLPGRDWSPLLLQQDARWGEEIVFHEYENTRAVQTPEWKFVRRHPGGPNEFYNLIEDPEERTNLVDNADCRNELQILSERLEDFFRRHSDQEFDFWRGGRNKAGNVLSKQ